MLFGCRNTLSDARLVSRDREWSGVPPDVTMSWRRWFRILHVAQTLPTRPMGASAPVALERGYNSDMRTSVRVRCRACGAHIAYVPVPAFQGNERCSCCRAEYGWTLDQSSGSRGVGSWTLLGARLSRSRHPLHPVT